MNGLVVGAALSLAAAAWVVAPILKAGAVRDAPHDDRGPGARSESDTGPACPSCGAQTEPAARFCSNCGRPLAPSRSRPEQRVG